MHIVHSQSTQNKVSYSPHVVLSEEDAIEQEVDR